MTITNKILIIIGIIITFGLLSFIIYQQYEMGLKQNAIEKQVILQKELNDKIIRAQSEYATKKDLENFIKNNGVDFKEIQKDLDKLSADIISANKVIAKSDGVKTDNISSTSTIINPNPVLPQCKDGTVCANADQFGYLTKQQNLKLNEPFGQTKVPIGEVGFSAWQDKPWNVNIHPRQYKLMTIVGEDENQRHYYYNKFTVNVEGKDYDIKIDSSQTKQEYPTAKFSFWNPRLFLGIDGGLNLHSMNGEFAPSLSIGLMSYGKYKTQPDFSLIQLGLGYGTVSDNLEFVITPFMYNVGRHIPLMNNLYLGPSLMIAPNGNVNIMGGLRVGL